MRRILACIAFAGLVCAVGCGKKDEAEPAKQADAPAPAQGGGAHVTVHLQDGSRIPGTIVASNQNDMVVAGDDGIERKIPLQQVKSVEYGTSAVPARTARQTPAQPATAPPQSAAAPPQSATGAPAAPADTAAPPPTPPATAPPPPPVATTKTFKLPVGSEVSVRTNEAIDSATANEGQTFDAQVTRDAKDSDGDIVIPRGSPARIVIRSASKGGKFHGAADLVLDLDSVVINGKPHVVSTVDMAEKGRDGVGTNKRTAEFAGGGAALGAIIGAIAGGGKGAAIGAGAGGGGGALTQILTKGGSIKVPAESVLTFSLDKPLRVTASQ
jgi:hypothetical protein